MINWNVESGSGFSDYTFSSRKCAIKELRKVGFRDANYRRNLHGGNKLIRDIRKKFTHGYYVLKHNNGTLAFVGYHDVRTPEGPEKTLWVRVIGKNELNYWSKQKKSNPQHSLKETWNVESGEGLSDFTFSTQTSAIKALQKHGFKDARFQRKLCVDDELTSSIQKLFYVGYRVLKHKNGTLAFVGYHDVRTPEGPEKTLWVRVIGKNELDYWRSKEKRASKISVAG